MEAIIYNRGLLAVILMRALTLDVVEAQEFVKLIENYCYEHGYTIAVEKEDE